jgi:hypothetical protein
VFASDVARVYFCPQLDPHCLHVVLVDHVSCLESHSQHSVCGQCISSGAHKGHKFLEAPKAVELLTAELTATLEEARGMPVQIDTNIAACDKAIANAAAQSARIIPVMEEFMDPIVEVCGVWVTRSWMCARELNRSNSEWLHAKTTPIPSPDVSMHTKPTPCFVCLHEHVRV